MNLNSHHCAELNKRLDAYIAKADEEIADVLEAEGFADAVSAVKEAEKLENGIAKVLRSQSNSLLASARESVDLDEFARLTLPDWKDSDEAGIEIARVVKQQMKTYVPKLADTYLKQTDGDLEAGGVSQRTLSWVDEWSDQLGEMMKLSTHTMIDKLLTTNLEAGAGIPELVRNIMDSGIRDSYYRARRVALTEVLRAHSVAQNEAIMQSPSADRKEWVHTGAYRNEPRQNHVAMDGQIVSKDDPFTLIGRDGSTYYPMFPRDPNLPPEESINCHCLFRPVASDDAMGMTYEERKQLQEDAIADADRGFEDEVSASARSKEAAANDRYRLDVKMPTLTEEQKVRYLGGKSKYALYEAGLIKNDTDLLKVQSKTLTELRNDGIITINSPAARHAVIGEYKVASKAFPAGRMIGGGHSQLSLAECDRRGIAYSINGSYSNGVRYGNVPSSKVEDKRTGNGQTWFPSSWTEANIRAAGTYVANSNAPLDGYHKTAAYDGVAVRILIDTNTGNVTTICPDYDQAKYIEGVTRS